MRRIQLVAHRVQRPLRPRRLHAQRLYDRAQALRRR
jgi:hypothetical protein